MDPLAIAAASLVAKAALEGAAKKAGEGGWSALSKVGGWLRDRFSHDGDDDGLAALDKVEGVPDSPSRVQVLARHLDARIGDDAGFQSELGVTVDQVGAVGGEVGAFVVHVRDNARVGKIVQVGVVNTETFNA